MGKNFTAVRATDLLSLLPCSTGLLLQDFSRQVKNFTAVTISKTRVRGFLRNLKNGFYFFFLKILRTYGTYVRFMIDIDRKKERRERKHV